MKSNEAVVFISIIIPVYNEEKRIEAFLTDVVTFLSKQTYSYEVIMEDATLVKKEEGKKSI